jgi:hypothetical protein
MRNGPKNSVDAVDTICIMSVGSTYVIGTACNNMYSYVYMSSADV